MRCTHAWHAAESRTSPYPRRAPRARISQHQQQLTLLWQR
jgi:hypothetical protein